MAEEFRCRTISIQIPGAEPITADPIFHGKAPYDASMSWFHAQHRLIGILADLLTFLGGCILARDAFMRLRELKKHRVDVEFDDEFSGLNLTDNERKAAMNALRWTFSGFALILVGFFFQLLLRFTEP